MQYLYETWEDVGDGETGPIVQVNYICLVGKNPLDAIRRHNRSKKLYKKLLKRKKAGKKLSYTEQNFLRYFEWPHRRFKVSMAKSLVLDTLMHDPDMPPDEFFYIQSNFELIWYYKEVY